MESILHGTFDPNPYDDDATVLSLSEPEKYDTTHFMSSGIL
jgi:hypothetical protein